jgi:hypothetical protein
MYIGLIFWVIMLLWLLGKLALWRGVNYPWILGSSDWLLFILFLLLGWHVFGPMIHN